MLPMDAGIKTNIAICRFSKCGWLGFAWTWVLSDSQISLVAMQAVSILVVYSNNEVFPLQVSFHTVDFEPTQIVRFFDCKRRQVALTEDSDNAKTELMGLSDSLGGVLTTAVIQTFGSFVVLALVFLSLETYTKGLNSSEHGEGFHLQEKQQFMELSQLISAFNTAFVFALVLRNFGDCQPFSRCL